MTRTVSQSSDRWISAFLYFGYVPRLRPGWREQPWATVPTRPDVARLERSELVARTGRALLASVEGDHATPHVVLLSGGNDSRAILGSLLHHYSSREIVAATFGTPGTLDFEIARKVARSVGVEHELLDLSSEKLTGEHLLAAAMELRHSPMWLFGGLGNRALARRCGTAGTYWSGYLGGPSTGSHSPAGGASATWCEAVQRHADRPPFAGRGSLTPSDRSRVEDFPAQGMEFDGPLSLDERVDFVLRQHPFLHAEHMMAGVTVRAPLLDPELLAIMFNAPAELRRDQVLYRQALAETFPRLFRLPLKQHLGLPAQAGPVRRAARRGRLSLGVRLRRRLPSIVRWTSPMVNHIDWNRALRERSDYIELASDAMTRLGALDVLPTDPSLLLAQHRRGERSVGLALTLLMSLDALLGVGAVPDVEATE